LNARVPIISPRQRTSDPFENKDMFDFDREFSSPRQEDCVEKGKRVKSNKQSVSPLGLLIHSIQMSSRVWKHSPLVATGGQILSWNGRLDNRDALISTFRNELANDLTDVAIVMCAYRKWESILWKN